MKKVLWIVGGLIGLLVVVALAAPFFVDLNDYKAEIAAKAKEATGRDLAIDGDISLSILPTPGVVIHGLRFGNAPGGSQPDMATLESATVKVAIMPYLTSNTVEVEEIVLEKPTFVFEKLKDGSGNWQIAPQAAAPEAGVTPEPSAAPAEGGSPMAVVIKSASIEGGTLIYRDLVAGTEQKVENLNIDLSLDSLTGPFQAEGGATVVNIPLGFRVKTGALDPTKPMPLDVSFYADRFQRHHRLRRRSEHRGGRRSDQADRHRQAVQQGRQPGEDDRRHAEPVGGRLAADHGAGLRGRCRHPGRQDQRAAPTTSPPTSAT